jgi:hypothetical protein
MLHEQKAGKGHNIKMRNESFQTVRELKCLGTVLSKQNCIHVEMECRFNLGVGWGLLLPIIHYRITCIPVCYPVM